VHQQRDEKDHAGDSEEAIVRTVHERTPLLTVRWMET
jgi:hypothetical protein